MKSLEIIATDGVGFDYFRQLAEEFPELSSVAVNEAISESYALAIERLLEKYNIDPATAKKAYKSIKKSTKGNLVASFNVSSSPTPLVAFGAQKSSNSVSVEVIRGSRKELSASSFSPALEPPFGIFLATMPSGHHGIFTRSGPKVDPEGGRYFATGSKRQKIKEAIGASVTQLAGAAEQFAGFSDDFVNLLDSNLGDIFDAQNLSQGLF